MLCLCCNVFLYCVMLLCWTGIMLHDMLRLSDLGSDSIKQQPERNAYSVNCHVCWLLSKGADFK